MQLPLFFRKLHSFYSHSIESITFCIAVMTFADRYAEGNFFLEYAHTGSFCVSVINKSVKNRSQLTNFALSI